MTDEERAEKLARAIDDLISGVESPDTSHGLDDEELAALLKVAEDRLFTSKAYRAEAADYESEVWQRVSDRIAGQAAASEIDLPRDQHEAMSDIIALRMRMAREILEVAESHRDEVWSRLQSRMGMGALADAPTLDEMPIDAINEDEVGALTRRSLARLAEIASDPVHIRFRERLSRDVALSTQAARRAPRRSTSKTRIALTAAVAVVIVAVAIGPLIITGIDGHPAVEIAESLASRIGLMEPDSAAAQP